MELLDGSPGPALLVNTFVLKALTKEAGVLTASCAQPVLGSAPPTPVNSWKAPAVAPLSAQFQYQMPSLSHTLVAGEPQPLKTPLPLHQLVARPLWLMPKIAPSVV